MSERILVGIVGAVARDVLILYLWHVVLAHRIPTVGAQAWGTVLGVAAGLVMVAARWWTCVWRDQVPAFPAIAVRLIAWTMFVATAAFATATDPRVGAVIWALVVSTGAPAVAPIAAYLWSQARHRWRHRNRPTPPAAAATPTRRRPAPAARLVPAFSESGDGT